MTQQCLQAAIDVCGPGVPFRAIGEAISSVADAAGEAPESYGVCQWPWRRACAAAVPSMLMCHAGAHRWALPFSTC